MSVGTPVVCHRSGGPADYINDNKDGLLVETLTADAYAARIQAVLAEPRAWNHLSNNANRKAEQWRANVVLDEMEAQIRLILPNASPTVRSVTS